MGIRRSGKPKFKPIKFSQFERTQTMLEQQQLQRAERITTNDLFPFDKYNSGFSAEATAAAETVADTLSTVNVTTIGQAASFFMTNAFVAFVCTAGTTTYARVSLRVLRGTDILFRIGGYATTVGTGVQTLDVNIPVNNFILRPGDVIQIEILRTTTAADFRIFGGCSVVSIV